MADKVFKNHSFSDIHNHNYILRELLDYVKQLQARIKELEGEILPMQDDSPSQIQQAFAWREVYKKLIDLGLYYFIPEPVMVNNIERCKQFLESLQDRVEELRKLKCPPISDGDTCICPIKELEQKVEEAERIIEVIMTQHWDMAACPCWVCKKGRKAGFRPREDYLSRNIKENLGHVTVEQSPEGDK